MPKMKQTGLTTAQCKGVVKAGLYADGAGLYLKVDGSSRRWVFRGRLNGKPIARGLGSFPAVGLGDAREKARECRRAVKDGVDPAAAKRDRARAAKATPTVQDVAASVWELRRPGWTNSKHAHEWWTSLETHAFPRIGGMAVNEVTGADVLAVLQPIWNSRRETASRVKQRLEVVMDYAVAMQYRLDNPVAAVKRALPSKRPAKAHYEALPYAELPAAVTAVRATGSRVTSLAVEFVVLTAARSGEVRGMTWDEVNLDDAIWEIPSSRMKARRGHRAPLSAQALAVLQEAGTLTGRSGLVFPSPRTGTEPLSQQLLGRLLERAVVGGTVHGFRSSFRDWAAEQSGAPWAVCESALAHSVGNQTEQAYARTDYLDARRSLMQAWADHVSPTDAALE